MIEKLTDKTLDLMTSSVSTATDLNLNLLEECKNSVSSTTKVTDFSTEDLNNKIEKEISNLTITQEISNLTITQEILPESYLLNKIFN